MPEEKFLRLVHAELGYRKLDGFQYKTLARKPNRKMAIRNFDDLIY